MIKSVAQSVQDFLNLESAGGLLLMAATALALIAANSPIAGIYASFLEMPVEVRVGAIHVAKPALHWINDGLMAVFFFLIVLELKREYLAGVQLSSLLHPLPLGIAAGLFLGKQAGVFLFSLLAVKLRIAQPLESVGWKTFYGVAVLCGIGFTMSLFISGLAFEPSTLGESVDERIGILAGSFLSAIAGYVVLDRTLPVHTAA